MILLVPAWVQELEDRPRFEVSGCSLEPEVARFLKASIQTRGSENTRTECLSISISINAQSEKSSLRNIRDTMAQSCLLVAGEKK